MSRWWTRRKKTLAELVGKPSCQADEDGRCSYVGHPVQIGESAGVPVTVRLCRWHGGQLERALACAAEREVTIEIRPDVLRVFNQCSLCHQADTHLVSCPRWKEQFDARRLEKLKQDVESLKKP